MVFFNIFHDNLNPKSALIIYDRMFFVSYLIIDTALKNYILFLFKFQFDRFSPNKMTNC